MFKLVFCVPLVTRAFPRPLPHFSRAQTHPPPPTGAFCFCRLRCAPYRANPNYLRNPKFCVGCFEFYLSKILRQHLKQGKKFFLQFFSAEPIFAELIETKVFFIFAEPIFAKGLGYLGLWDCSPILHRHTNVDHLDCGIAVQSYAGIQMWIS